MCAAVGIWHQASAFALFFIMTTSIRKNATQSLRLNNVITKTNSAISFFFFFMDVFSHEITL